MKNKKNICEAGVVSYNLLQLQAIYSGWQGCTGCTSCSVASVHIVMQQGLLCILCIDVHFVLQEAQSCTLYCIQAVFSCMIHPTL